MKTLIQTPYATAQQAHQQSAAKAHQQSAAQNAHQESAAQKAYQQSAADKPKFGFGNLIERINSQALQGFSKTQKRRVTEGGTLHRLGIQKARGGDYLASRKLFHILELVLQSPGWEPIPHLTLSAQYHAGIAYLECKEQTQW